MQEEVASGVLSQSPQSPVRNVAAGNSIAERVSAMKLGKSSAANEPTETRKPAFVLRARQTQTAEQIRRREAPFYTQVGAMWPASWSEKDDAGKETGKTVQGWSIKINSAPMGWDGDCVAVPYREKPQK